MLRRYHYLTYNVQADLIFKTDHRNSMLNADPNQKMLKRECVSRMNGWALL